MCITLNIRQVHNVCLFKCDKCEVYFKSKKGYESELADGVGCGFVLE